MVDIIDHRPFIPNLEDEIKIDGPKERTVYLLSPKPNEWARTATIRFEGVQFGKIVYKEEDGVYLIYDGQQFTYQTKKDDYIDSKIVEVCY